MKLLTVVRHFHLVVNLVIMVYHLQFIGSIIHFILRWGVHSISHLHYELGLIITIHHFHLEVHLVVTSNHLHFSSATVHFHLGVHLMFTINHPHFSDDIIHFILRWWIQLLYYNLELIITFLIFRLVVQLMIVVDHLYLLVFLIHFLMRWGVLSLLNFQLIIWRIIFVLELIITIHHFHL